MAQYRKPNGKILEVNDTSAAYAESLGWEKVEAKSDKPTQTADKPAKTPKKRTRRTKEQMKEDGEG